MSAIMVFIAWATANWGSIATATGAVLGIWKSYDSFRKERQKAVNSKQALATVVAGLHLQPQDDPTVVKAIDTVRRTAEANGSEAELNKVVNEVKAIMKDRAFLPERDETDDASVERAAKAIMALREKKANSSSIIHLLFLILIPMALFACRTEVPVRLVGEQVWYGAGANGEDVLVVEWPSGIKASDIETSDTQSHDGELRANSAVNLPKLQVPSVK